jgi:ubiquinone/menaquinone biosynthesis C-methylase UbiE
MLEKIKPYLLDDATVIEHSKYLEFPIKNPSEEIKANAYYFNHPEWAAEYLQYCHRSDTFKSRWSAAMGDWTNKVVLDIGCGPGNILATLQGKPKLIIGVDVASTSLELAHDIGYLPILADANHLPFIPGFADIVVLNAILHHCEDMKSILKEAARMVKPGGLIITDHDPQLSAWDYKGAAKLLWNARLYVYKIMGRGFHKTDSQQEWALACEIHHKPGHGVTRELFKEILEPLNFSVNIYPHNHDLGSEVLKGNKGQAELKYRIGNLLSGRNPKADGSALSLMCVGTKAIHVENGSEVLVSSGQLAD